MSASKEPTQEEIRRVLAEFMGWTEVVTRPSWGDVEGTPPGIQLGDLIADVPEYSHDLAAMYAVEDVLQGIEYMAFGDYMRALFSLRHLDEDLDLLTWRGVFDVTHATAEQRALAAYRVIMALKEAQA